jgi:DnaJ-class molecular chaperone
MSNEADCPTCLGKGKVQVMQKPAGRFAKIAEPKFVKCDDCGGTGKKPKR